MTRKQGIRCFDLCCGAGALSHGFTSAGATILGGIDIDERALSTARANHPNASWENTSIEDFAKAIRSQPEHASWGANTLLAGLPCQGFSAAGKRDPGDPRNHLYRHFLRIARLLKPQYVVIENVLGLGAPRNKHVLSRLQVGLRSLGYSVATRILDASNYGVAQRRRRIFVIGVNGGDAEWVFECIKVNGNSPSVRDAFVGLPKNRERPAISHVFMRHGPGVTRMLRTLRPGGPISYRRLRWNERAPTLVAGHRALPVHPDEPRAISVREAARLQGFPDGYVFHGSNSARIEHVANAVPPPLARAVAKGLGAFPDYAERVQGQVFLRLETLTDAHLRQQFTTVFRRAFRDRRRRFPWRQVRDPYKILITEILLQRTNADLAMTVWRDVLRMIPSVTEAANVDLRSLLPLMQRIGIRNRARTIKTLARCLLTRFDGRVPVQFDELLGLPGVGLYIASAVRVFSHGRRDFPVDSNVFRFVSRFFGITLAGRKSEGRQLREVMLTLLPKDRLHEYVYGFLDFGAIVCKPKRPDCTNCPLSSSCRRYGV